MEVKSCSRCKTEKSINNFHKWKYSKDGLKGYCKECSIKSVAKWQKENRDKCNNANYKYNKTEKARENLRNWAHKNKEKIREYKRKYTKKYPEKVLNKALKYNYGISLNKFNELFKNQGGVCAICGNSSTKRLCVDHCHKSGKVRGLLCDSCNKGLGNFKDNIDFLLNSIKYLAK